MKIFDYVLGKFRDLETADHLIFHVVVKLNAGQDEILIRFLGNKFYAIVLSSYIDTSDPVTFMRFDY